MKNIKINAFVLSILAVMAIGINGCKEVGPQLPWGNTSVLSDTTYVENPVATAETKNVLIEELTGVSCINCPQGHDIVKNLIASSVGRVIAVSMHSTSEPAAQDESIGSLTTQVIGCPDVDALIGRFGEPGQRPAGAIDRQLYTDITGSPIIWTDRSNWINDAQMQMTKTTPVNLVLGSTYDATTKTITVSAEVHYTATQPDSSQALTIFLTEDSIVTAQQNGSIIDTYYVQNYVMRKALTTATGDQMSVPMQAGRVVRRIYVYHITNAVWKPEHMNIVAFINKISTSAPDVLQTKTLKVIH